MIHIAVVEDEEIYVSMLQKYIERFGQEISETFHVVCFPGAESFLSEYRPVYHIILMDIATSGMNGLKAARRLRRMANVMDGMSLLDAGRCRYICSGVSVLFPFGYGLSYTMFEQSITNLSETEDAVKITVEVKNIGHVDEVVQLYYNPPYTDYDKDNRIEKATRNLAAFEK